MVARAGLAARGAADLRDAVADVLASTANLLKVYRRTLVHFAQQ